MNEWRDKHGQLIQPGDILQYEETQRLIRVYWCDEYGLCGHYIWPQVEPQPWIDGIDHFELDRLAVIGHTEYVSR